MSTHNPKVVSLSLFFTIGYNKGFVEKCFFAYTTKYKKGFLKKYVQNIEKYLKLI